MAKKGETLDEIRTKLASEEAGQLRLAWQMRPPMVKLEDATTGDALAALERIAAWARWADHVLRSGVLDEPRGRDLVETVASLDAAISGLPAPGRPRGHENRRNTVIEQALALVESLVPPEHGTDSEREEALITFATDATRSIAAQHGAELAQRVDQRREDVADALRSHRNSLGKANRRPVAVLTWVLDGEELPTGERRKGATKEKWDSFRDWQANKAGRKS